MKTRLQNSGLCLLLTIIFLSGSLQAQEKKSEKALLWKVTGKQLKEPSYLFGTYHLLGEKYLSEVPETAKPFANAKGVVVELVLDSSKLTSVMMKGIMLDKKNSTLLSPEDFALVDSTLQKLSGYSLKMLDMMKPAQISALISLLQAKSLNEEILKKYDGTPLDVHFAVSAKKAGKTVTPLETMEQQFDMLFSHYPVEEQAKQLVASVKQKELSEKSSIELTRLYMSKDVYGLLALMNSFPEELTGNTDYMLKDRNVNWMKTLPDLMKSGSQFIAVGAGHLPGPNGLIELLRKEGYQVTAVTK